MLPLGVFKMNCYFCGKRIGIPNKINHDFVVILNWEREYWCKECYFKFYQPYVIRDERQLFKPDGTKYLP